MTLLRTVSDTGACPPRAGSAIVRDIGYPTAAARAAALARLRKLCLALPETTERLSHGAPTFFIRGKTSFLMLLDNHHGDGRFAIWCAAEPGTQEALVAGDPDRFFRPPYVGHRGWLGVMLHGRVDWDDVAGIAEDAFCAVAPKKLVDELGR